MDEKIVASELRMVDNIKGEMAASEHRLKDYIDRKLSDHTADMFKRLDERYHKENSSNRKSWNSCANTASAK